MDYLSDIKAYEDDGKTDAEIAALLAPTTRAPIPVLEVRRLLRERNLWLKDPITRARSFGTIGAAMVVGVPPELYAALVSLEAALYDQSATQLSTDDPTVGKLIADTLTALRGLGAITQEDEDAFYDLAGGRPFAGIDPADIAAARQAHAAAIAAEAFEQAWVTQLNETINPALSSGDTASLVTAIRAAADAIEAA